MKQTRLLMGMPITVELVGAAATPEAIDEVFAYFTYVDEKFSTYKPASEISRINAGQLTLAEAGVDMQTVFQLAEQTRQETGDYFDIARDGRWDPSGIVKGWAIHNAAARLRASGLRNFYVEAGGDIQADGHNRQGMPWRVGIRSPFNMDEIVKVVALSDRGIATSGTYVRGEHIYNPRGQEPLNEAAEIVSLSVIGPNIYDADRFATAAFAMGREGIMFVERLAGFEGYMIDAQGQATYTGGFEHYIAK
jgi:thiamine biosynthesis lipoprotein